MMEGALGLGRIQHGAVLLCLCGTLWAQQPKASPASAATDFSLYEGRPVVSLELAGQPHLLSPSAQASLLASLPQQSGTPLDVGKMQQSLAALRSVLPQDKVTGISVEVVPEVAGIRVQFLLQPAAYFGVFQFPGALRFPYLRLLEASHYANQSPYSDPSLSSAVSGLQDFFQQEGYFQAGVKAQIQSLPAQGLVNVDFTTALGPRAHYGALIFQGATPAQAARMRDDLTSWTARLLRRSVIPGHTYSLARLQSAAAHLQSSLNGEGYLGAQVSLAGARYHPDTNLADITFAVHPGPLVKLQVTGAHLWPWTRHSLLPITSESSVDPLLVQDGQENLANYFASQGYFSAQVTTKVQTTTATGETETRVTQASAAALTPPPPPPAAPATPPASKSIVYKIDKGPRHDVEGISFSGNTFYNRDDLLPLVKIQTEGLFSHGNFSQALLRQSVSNIQTLYQTSGYSSVAVTPEVTHPGGNLAVNFKITEGPQDFVQSLRIEGNTVSPDLFAPQGLMVGTGTPFAQQLISQDRAQILAYYLSHGFLNAAFRASAQRIAGQRHLVNVVYHITEGPQVRARRILFAGSQYTQPRLLRLLTANLQPNTFLTENDLLTAESRLYSPGIFDWATVAPRRPITDQTNADVVVKVHEAARNSLVYGFGFDLTNRGGSVPSGTVALPGLPVVGLPSNFTTSQATFFGPSVNAQYTRLNFTGNASTLSFGGYAGRLDQRGSITYSDPHLFWSPFSGNLLLSAEHDAQNPIFTASTGQASYQLERPLNLDRTTNLFLRYSYSQTSLTRLLIPDLVPARDRNIRLSTLSATFLRDTRDNPLDAHKGMLESYELDYSARALGSTVNFAKLQTQTAYYKQMADGIVWANSLRLGAAHALGSSFVPLSQAFFTGGGSTLRGFPLDGAGPQKTIPACGNPNDPATCTLIQVPVGGNELLILNSELRIPTPQIWDHLGIALFYDGGNVFDHVGINNIGAGYTNSIGVGLRYQTAVGPIRFDLGHNLNGLPGVQATQFFITLGQAF